MISSISNMNNSIYNKFVCTLLNDFKYDLNNLMVKLQPWSPTLLLLIPGPLWHRVVAPDRVLSEGQIDLFDI